jgi:hypothetical protein
MGATEVYGLYRGTVSGNYLTGSKTFSMGLIKDVSLAFGGDANHKNTEFNAQKKLLVGGVQVDFNVPGNFSVALLAGKEWNHCGVNAICVGAGKTTDPVFNTNAHIEVNYMQPLAFTGLPLKFSGFTNFVTPKGKDGSGAKTKLEILSDNRLTLDFGKVVGYQANKIDDAKVKIENVGFPVREPMLAQGKVDAITGFSFSSYFNLLQNNIKAEDISVMLMSDHGIVLYGNAIMVNPDFAKANPKIVAGFVRATVKGFIDTAKDPDAAIKSVMKRNETADEKIELDRLKMALRDNMVTPWVKANGVGGIDAARFAKSIDQIADTYEFKNRPTTEQLFTSEFLPPASERKF